MLLLDSKSGSISVSVPHDLESDWLTAGSNIRALVYVPDLDTLARLNRIVPLIASAPEISVEKAEEAEAEAVRKADLAKAKEAEKLAVQFAAQERRFARGKETSRSAAYNFRSASLPSGTGPICQLSANALRVYPAYRAFVHQANRRLGDKTVDSITSSILYFCEKEKVDPRLMISMILAESNFDPNSTSRVGAMGLGQLMPGTAAGLGVQNAYDPIQNIAAAAHILSVRIRDYGGCRDDLYVPQRVLYLTMAAYNAGPGAVKKYGGVPPYRETQRYVRKVEQYYIQLSGGS
jgi:soluble lytic murein transglycosylase-like protein